MKSLDKEDNPLVIYCDNHILVALKRAGQLVQPDLHEEMRLYIQMRFAKKGRAFLEPLHRLDKPVSGLVLFARTSKALERLNSAMQNHQIHKTYLAKVEGKITSTPGTLDHYLKHQEFHAEIVSEETPGAKRAILHYKVLATTATASLLEIELVTGRYHQIRAQFAHIGHPIIGDKRYGSKYAHPSIALSNIQLSFTHPVTHAAQCFTTAASFDRL